MSPGKSFAASSFRSIPAHTGHATNDVSAEPSHWFAFAFDPAQAAE